MPMMSPLKTMAHSQFSQAVIALFHNILHPKPLAISRYSISLTLCRDAPSELAQDSTGATSYLLCTPARTPIGFIRDHESPCPNPIAIAFAFALPLSLYHVTFIFKISSLYRSTLTSIMLDQGLLKMLSVPNYLIVQWYLNFVNNILEFLTKHA